MALPRIGTRGILIAAMVVCVAIGAVVARIVYAPSALLSRRHGLRAALIMPADLRSFPVEQHVRQGESFAYAMSTHRGVLTRWRLSIDTDGPRRNWRDALEGHILKRGFRPMGRRQIAPKRLYLTYGASGARLFVLKMEGSPTERLAVTLEYWPNLNKRAWPRPLDWIRHHIARIKRLLLGKNAAPNATTRAS
ncbi:MAG: hypothetical protein JW741_02610 [Sedimentisphaerales bacterium]|nr:hypothetical protein [Sedimentisphaerales bacterium]